MGSLRKLKRSVAKHQMEMAGVVQPNKSIYNNIDRNWRPIKEKRPSFFSQHWKDKLKEDK